MNKDRELANSTGNASEAIVESGEKTKKQFILNSLPLQFAELHRSQSIHIHDLEFYDVTYNCIGLDAASLIGSGDFSFSHAVRRLFRGIVDLTNRQSGGIGMINFDKDMAFYVHDETDAELEEQLYELFCDLNSNTRKGCEKAYITFNFGLDVSEKGRRISKALLSTCMKGAEKEASFIFPNLVFKLRKEINRTPGSPNYDLYTQALRTTSRRMIPTYLNCDSSANTISGINPEKIGVMGCRSRVVNNLYGEKTALHRGNVACVTVNLVQIAYESHSDMNTFFSLLNERFVSAKEMLLHRYHTLAEHADFSEYYSLGYYTGSEKRDAYEMLKNGTLAIGFIGVWDSLAVLHNKNWSTAKEMKPYADEAFTVVKTMRELTDAMIEETHLNFSLLGSAAEGVTGMFACYDSMHMGKGNPVSEKGYYSNSFHIPVDVDADFYEKFSLEGRFHALCNGGSISYVELNEMPFGNTEAVHEIVDFACDQDCNYIGINFQLDHCRSCGFTGKIADSCPECNSRDISHLRRVSGYLSEVKNFTAGKTKELAARIPHCE